MPNAPLIKNNNPSKPCKKAAAILFFEKSKIIITISSRLKTTMGVKKYPRLLMLLTGYKLVVDKTR